MEIGQPGRLHALEHRLVTAERAMQRMRGVATAFGTGLVLLNLVLTYMAEKH